MDGKRGSEEEEETGSGGGQTHLLTWVGHRAGPWAGPAGRPTNEPPELGRPDRQRGGGAGALQLSRIFYRFWWLERPSPSYTVAHESN